MDERRINVSQIFVSSSSHGREKNREKKCTAHFFGTPSRHAQWADMITRKIYQRVQQNEQEAAFLLNRMYERITGKLEKKSELLQYDVFYRNPFLNGGHPVATVKDGGLGEDARRQIGELRETFERSFSSKKKKHVESKESKKLFHLRARKTNDPLTLLGRFFKFQIMSAAKKNGDGAMLHDTVGMAGPSERPMTPTHKVNWRTPFVTDNELTVKEMIKIIFLEYGRR